MESGCDYLIPKRSYIYQTSQEVKIVKNLGAEREKIDSSSDEKCVKSGRRLLSRRADCVLDILLPSEDNVICSDSHSPKSAQDASDFKFFYLVPEGDDHLHKEREKLTPVGKTVSAKGDAFHFDVDVNTCIPSTESRLDPHRKIKDAFINLESHHISSPPRKKITDPISAGVSDIRQFNLPQEPSFINFSKTEQIVEHNTKNLIEDAKEDVISSPVHLKGILKQENRGDESFYEFIMKDQEDVLFAKTHRSETAVDWSYTFHHMKKKTNKGIWSIRDRRKKSSLFVGRMCVSCHLFAEATNDGYMNNYLQLESVLYDIDKARIKESSSDDSPQYIEFSSNQQGLRKTNNYVYPENCKHASPDLPSNSGLYVSHPWGQKDPFPDLEIAAIVMQVPIECNNLELEKDDLFLSKGCLRVAPPYVDEKVKLQCARSININVLAPARHHGVPHTEGGPSPLIERWISGGRCDCGGWDIGCPILILENNHSKADSYSNACFSHSVKLYVQGSKDRMPALTVTAEAEGEYLVAFHAQFSALQAFAVSVAVLHCLDRNILMMRSNVLKSLLKDELRHFLYTATEDVMEQEVRTRKPIPSKYILDPPFSPIQRA